MPVHRKRSSFNASIPSDADAASQQEREKGSGQSTADFRPDDLVIWKYRAGLVGGHVRDVDEASGVIHIQPMRSGTHIVSRHADKLFPASALSKHDLEELRDHGGHMPRRDMTSRIAYLEPRLANQDSGSIRTAGQKRGRSSSLRSASRSTRRAASRR